MKSMRDRSESGLRAYASLALLVFMTTATGTASAQSTLLASFVGVHGSGTTSAQDEDVAFVALEMGFSQSAVGTQCQVERIGCEVVPLGSVLAGAVFEFDSSNTHFDTVVAKLTDNDDGTLSTAVRLFDAGGTFLHGNASGSPEFNLVGDLSGAQIDFVRLIVNSFSVTERQCCGGGGVEVSANLTWELHSLSLPVIDPTADVSPSCSIGNGTTVAAETTLNKNCMIGMDVTIGVGVEINKNTSIGDGTTIGDNTAIAKDGVIGAIVTIGANVTIGRNVMIGEFATIGDGVVIGKDVVIAAGAMVPDGTMISNGGSFQ
ncbi:MAG: hypothetical protein ACE5KS_08665 [Woeseiaceae bacterium]